MDVSTIPASRPWLIRAGQFFFKYRDLLFPLVFLPLALGTKPHKFLGDPRSDVPLQLLGVLLVVGGQGLRALVIGLEYIVRGGRNKQIYANRLVQGGIFAHSRNPLYLGNLLIVTGLVVIHNGMWMYLIALPFYCFVYIAIVAAEEQYLAAQFGAEYADYCRRVPRFLVRPSGLWTTIRSMRFDWKQLVRKEYGTMFSTGTAVLALMAWELICADGWEVSVDSVRLLILLWIPCVLAYVTARLLKKRGVLGKG
jgi:protein-S-isoprenylcysteine O-methyltransferase Ste14